MKTELTKYMIEHATAVLVDKESYATFAEGLAGTPVEVVLCDYLPAGSAVFIAHNLEMPGHDRAIAGFRAHLEKILKEKP